VTELKKGMMVDISLSDSSGVEGNADDLREVSSIEVIFDKVIVTFTNAEYHLPSYHLMKVVSGYEETEGEVVEQPSS
jgi:hypothetical protein